jgi:hypothetical protein
MLSELEISYFRRLLLLLERIAIALEKSATHREAVAKKILGDNE